MTTGDTEAQPTAESPRPRPGPLLGELLGVAEHSLIGLTGPAAAFVSPLGPPRPVLVLPGFVTGDSATFALRTFLRSLGHKPVGWGQGLNVGASHHIAKGVDRVLRELAQRYGQTVDIVGWSAGGMLGRVLASHRTELVRQVISLGSPIEMTVDQTNIGRLQALSSRFYLPMPKEFDVNHIPVPSTTVWTRSDGVVPGPNCRQEVREGAEVVEVRGSHLGLVANPAVLYLLADRIAQVEGEWAPFSPRPPLRHLYPSMEHLHHDNDGADWLCDGGSQCPSRLSNNRGGRTN